MEFPKVTFAEWRAQVEKDLVGRSFEKTLVQETIEGIAIAPLYVDAPQTSFSRDPHSQGFRICMRHEDSGAAEHLTADVEGGADALWLRVDDARAKVLADEKLAATFLVIDVGDELPSNAIERVASRSTAFALNVDPIAQHARGDASFEKLVESLARLGPLAKQIESKYTGSTSIMVSTIAYHDAGADAVDEIAIALSSGVAYLEALREAGLTADEAAGQIALQIPVARDTFLELCKVRALRTCWQKVIAASGAKAASRTLVHAVASTRTLTVRDPWVNMLRVTTEVFSAVLGGADLVTPRSFDDAYPGAEHGAQGRRIARNTGLILREESFLGKVHDPAGGSYYLDTLTVALARDAWTRFQSMEKDGGVVALLQDGRLVAKLEATWQTRLDRLVKRKTPILGVSEFANLDETLPHAIAHENEIAAKGTLPIHRDSEVFEALRARADAIKPSPEVVLVTLGTLAESRARVGFSAGFFAAGGFRSRESANDEAAPVVCLCGSDERYAAEAVTRVRSLKAAGAKRVLLAGRPGPLEASLREAGIDGFIFVGCDLIATLSDLMDHLVDALS